MFLGWGFAERVVPEVASGLQLLYQYCIVSDESRRSLGEHTPAVTAVSDIDIIRRFYVVYRYYHPKPEDCRRVVTQVSNWSAWWLAGDVCGMVYQGSKKQATVALLGGGQGLEASLAC